MLLKYFNSFLEMGKKQFSENLTFWASSKKSSQRICRNGPKCRYLKENRCHFEHSENLRNLYVPKPMWPKKGSLSLELSKDLKSDEMKPKITTYGKTDANSTKAL